MVDRNGKSSLLAKNIFEEWSISTIPLNVKKKRKKEKKKKTKMHKGGLIRVHCEAGTSIVVCGPTRMCAISSSIIYERIHEIRKVYCGLGFNGKHEMKRLL